LIADDSADGVAAAPFHAIAQADSVVVDPHKHGLQPYGCGAVLFKDPQVIGHYKIPPTPISPPTNCTWVRSRWSAPAPALRPPPCG
jgi:glutamate/tyrosine decarboxylase-like PLP-dependent enzyme